MKKRIGISFTRTKFHHYWHWFTHEDLKGDLELVNLSFERNNVEEITTCDGFVLTGGIDVDPQLYGGTYSYANQPSTFERERDAFEERIYRHALVQRLPILGICRGLQLINVLEGGSLIQDLGNEGNEIHEKKVQDKQHGVSIEKDSLLHEIAQQTTGQVNSAHHQGIDLNKLSSNLRATTFALTAIPIIESLEFKDKSNKPFMLCVQWHPERMVNKEVNPLSQKIKERFIEEVKRNKQ
ncbi:MAG: gamma-glutamyl-gamma-aminobutyrate hydrolase family protein [Flavisolibacter sp.]|nr:gamma-glutamyl-gamma-aminobutyrate hydrolase family protein [Flavisolibacter sp.]